MQLGTRVHDRVTERGLINARTVLNIRGDNLQQRYKKLAIYLMMERFHGREADHFFARKWARARAHDHFSFPRDKLCLNLYFFLLASGNCKINIFASE